MPSASSLVSLRCATGWEHAFFENRFCVGSVTFYPKSWGGPRFSPFGNAFFFQGVGETYFLIASCFLIVVFRIGSGVGRQIPRLFSVAPELVPMFCPQNENWFGIIVIICSSFLFLGTGKPARFPLVANQKNVTLCRAHSSRFADPSLSLVWVSPPPWSVCPAASRMWLGGK